MSATYAAGSQGSINSSATFADNANATGVPTNWGDWVNGSGTRVTGIAPQPYAFTLVGGAGASAGIYSPLTGRIATGWHVIEADVTLNSGAFTGAGVYLDWDGSGNLLNFSSDADITGSVVGAGTPGQLYRFRKLVEVVKGASYNGMYAMCHWGGGSFGSIDSANSITWHRCAIRAASQAEIEARQAKLDLVTANANIATNASAIATEASSRAAADTTLTASFTSLSAKTDPGPNLMPYPKGQVVAGESNVAASALGWVLAGGVGSPSFVQLWYAPRGGSEYYIEWSSGFNSLPSSYQLAYFDIPVPDGGTYTFSLTGQDYNCAAYIQMQCLNAARDTDTTISSTTANLPASMGRVSVTSTGNSSTRYLRIFISIAPQNVTGYAAIAFTNIKVEPGSVATMFTDDYGITNSRVRLATAEASIATNASAISTETSARAASEAVLRASIYGKTDSVIPDADMRDTDWWNNASGCTFGDADGGWRTRRQIVFANGTYDQYSEYFPVEPGATYRVRTRVWNNGGSWSGWFHPLIHIPYHAWWSLKHGTAIDPSFHDATNGIVAAQDTGELEWILTNPTGITNNANRQWQFRFYGSFTGGPVVITVEIIRLDQYATVATNTSAIATLEGAAAVWEVVAAASGGTPARIGLKTGIGGAEAWIDATNIFLGDNTSFEDPYNSFYTEASSKRYRFGGPFPASGDLVMWFGPTSVALNSETKTNGYFSFGSDGKIYYGAAELVTGTNPLTCSFSPTDVTHTRTGGSLSPTPSVTATGGGGSGSYSYSWSVESIETGDTPTIANAGTATATLGGISMVAGEDAVGRLRCTVTDTTTGRQKAFFWSYSYIDLI